MDIKAYNHQVIEEFRAHKGKAGQGNAPMLLLTTTGARSGQRHTTPLMYMPDRDQQIIIASNMGAPVHPAWYHNLLAHPEVTVEVGTKTFAATAIVTEGSERQRIWTTLIEQYPFFIDHQTKTTRLIPLVALVRKADPQTSM